MGGGTTEPETTEELHSAGSKNEANYYNTGQQQDIYYQGDVNHLAQDTAEVTHNAT